MFNLIKKRSSYLSGKGVSPSREVGQEEDSPHSELAKHHRTLADTHAGIADTHAKMAGEAAPSDEVDQLGGEPVGAGPSPHEKGSEAMSGEDLEKILGGEESPAGEAGESSQLEADEKLGNFREKGGSLRNSKDEETPLSHFAAFRKKGKGK